jgi:hypothetical protein
MPGGTRDKNGHRSDVPENWFDGQKHYSVILEEIRPDVETPDSFAIKFSLLTKTPISKMKHIVSSLPTPIWTGQGTSRAENILALIEEAGGRGSIVEGEEATLVKGSSRAGKNRVSCRWCGFPIKAGDTHCDFCMTPVGDVEKEEIHWERGSAQAIIPPKRLLCYILILVAGVIFAIVTR